MTKKIAVILSGCGFKDGSEITESVCTLIAISAAGATYQCFAPDLEVGTVDHWRGGDTGPRRILSESARLCRGQIQPLSQLKPTEFDGLVFPGGYGAAQHLCNWAQKGADCTVLPEVASIIMAFYQGTKPIGAICIAPVLIAKVLGNKGVTVTIGNDHETAAEIAKTGAHHAACAVDDYVTDRECKVITTPAYMFDHASPHLILAGIRGLINELVEMA